MCFMFSYFNRGEIVAFMGHSSWVSSKSHGNNSDKNIDLQMRVPSPQVGGRKQASRDSVVITHGIHGTGIYLQLVDVYGKLV